MTVYAAGCELTRTCLDQDNVFDRTGKASLDHYCASRDAYLGTTLL